MSFIVSFTYFKPSGKLYTGEDNVKIDCEFPWEIQNAIDDMRRGRRDFPGLIHEHGKSSLGTQFDILVLGDDNFVPQLHTVYSWLGRQQFA